MAMGLGAFIAAALGLASANALGAIGQAKMKEKHEADILARQLMMKEINQYAITPGPQDSSIGEKLKLAGISGSQAKGIEDLIQGTRQSTTNAFIEKTMRMRKIAGDNGQDPDTLFPFPAWVPQGYRNLSPGYGGQQAGGPATGTPPGGTVGVPAGMPWQAQGGAAAPFVAGGQGWAMRGTPPTTSDFMAAQGGQTPPALTTPGTLPPRLPPAQAQALPPGISISPGAPAPVGRPAVNVIPPGGAPPGGPTAQPMPATQGPEGVPPGGPVAQPMPAVTPAPTAEAPQAQAYPLEAQPTAQDNTEVQDLIKAVGPRKPGAGVGISIHDKEAGVTLTLPPNEKVIQSKLLQAAGIRKAAPANLAEAANRFGTAIPPEEFKNYSQQDYYHTVLPELTAQYQKTGFLDPNWVKMKNLSYLAERGGAIPEVMKDLWPTPQDADNSLRQYFALNPTADFGTALTRFRQNGANFTNEGVAAVAREFRDSRRGLLEQMYPGASPQAIDKMLAKQTGYIGMTDAERNQLTQPAPIGEKATGAMARAGQRLPLLSDVTGEPAPGAPGAAAGKTPAQQAQEQALTEEAQQSGKVREQDVLGAARGTEGAKDIKVLTQPEREKYVDMSTLQTVGPITQRAAEQGVASGKIGTLNVTPQSWADIVRFNRAAHEFLPQIIDRPNGIFSLGPFRRQQLQQAIQPLDIGWQHFGVRLPAGTLESLPIVNTLINKENFTPQQVQDAIQLEAFAKFSGVALARMQGEKGQGVSAKMFETAIDAIPRFPRHDYALAKGSLTNLQRTAGDLMESGVSVVGKPRMSEGAPSGAPAAAPATPREVTNPAEAQPGDIVKNPKTGSYYQLSPDRKSWLPYSR